MFSIVLAQLEPLRRAEADQRTPELGKIKLDYIESIRPLLDQLIKNRAALIGAALAMMSSVVAIATLKGIERRPQAGAR